MATAPETRHEALYLPILIGGALLCVLAFGLVNFAVDPLQILRRASYEPIYSENQRHQNAGLIRTHDYAAIVVGTSHVENFSPRLIEELTGLPTIKLAIEGSKASEQAAMVRAAIEKGRVERVIWGLDYLAFRDSPASPWGDGALPRHLYELSADTIGGYLLSLDTLLLSRDALLGRGHGDLETLNRWGETSSFGPRQVEAAWRRIQRKLARDHARAGTEFPSTIDLTRRKVDFFVGQLARSNPDVRFDLFFSPYSVVAYLVDHIVSEREFSERLAFKRSVVELVGREPNVRVYDFQTDRRVTHDLSRYKDVHHFDVRVSDGLVRSVIGGAMPADPARYERTLEIHAQQVERFMAQACREPQLRAYCLDAPATR